MKAYLSKEEKEKDEEAEGGKALEKGRQGGLEGALKGGACPLLPSVGDTLRVLLQPICLV